MGLIIDDDSYENIEEENLDELMDDFDDFNEIIDYSQPPEESIKITDTENIDIIEKQKRHLDNITKVNIHFCIFFTKSVCTILPIPRNSRENLFLYEKCFKLFSVDLFLF
jgi:hypothetical protein